MSGELLGGGQWGSRPFQLGSYPLHPSSSTQGVPLRSQDSEPARCQGALVGADGRNWLALVCLPATLHLRPAVAQARGRLPQCPFGRLGPTQNPFLSPTRSVGSSNRPVRGDSRCTKGPGLEVRLR